VDPTLIAWRLARFEELSPREIHDLFQARAAVFVVEQNCAFQDLDGLDPQCWHLLGLVSGKDLVAYCRIVPPGVKYAEPSIGRVVTTNSVRGTGQGRELMREALARAEKLWPGRAIRIGAQQRLERFYEDFGFTTASQPYDEDGIPHVEMVRPAARVKDGGQTVG
jgi:ElaA protein